MTDPDPDLFNDRYVKALYYCFGANDHGSRHVDSVDFAHSYAQFRKQGYMTVQDAYRKWPDWK
jgi:hypothetical protein